MVYHMFTLEKRRKTDIDFLSFWYAESRSDAEGEEEVSDSTADILKGIEELRNRVVEEASGSPLQVSLNTVRTILESIRFHSSFPESIDYWNSVIGSTAQVRSRGITVRELSEAVVSFLQGISAPSSNASSSEGAETAVSLMAEEIESIRRFVDTSLSDMRKEIRTEKMKQVESVASTQASSLNASPIPVPSLPISNRRQTAADRRSWCCDVSECPMQ